MLSDATRACGVDLGPPRRVPWKRRPLRRSRPIPERTPYQKGIVRRYYEHRGDIAVQKLSEIVSTLYTETSERKIATAWKAAERHLLAAGAHREEVKGVVERRDLAALAKIVSERF